MTPSHPHHGSRFTTTAATTTRTTTTTRTPLFAAQPPARTPPTAAEAGGGQGNNNNKKKKKKKTRKPPKDRRFSQTVHHPAAPYTTTTRESDAMSSSRRSSTSLPPPPKKQQQQQPPQFNANRMWRHQHKSIEQMEQRLTARWGTDLSKWTARDGDNDDDNDDNDELDNQWMAAEDNEDPTTQVVSTDAPRFRAKPVRDPWASTSSSSSSSQREEEDGQHAAKSSASSSSFFVRQGGQLGNDTGANAVDDNDNDNVSVQRAQRNQERLRRRREEATTSSNNNSPSTSSTTTSRRRDDGRQQRQRSPPPPPANRLDVGDLIAPRPAGGSGTFQQQPQPRQPQQQGSYDNDNDRAATATTKTGGTFFFSPTPIGGAKKPDTTTTTTTTTDGRNSNQQQQQEEQATSKPQKRQRRLRNPSVPILNEHGDPILLTLEQAERNFQNFVQSYVHSEEPNNEQGEEQATALPTTTTTTTTTWQDVGITHPLLLENLQYHMECLEPLPAQVKACPLIADPQKDVLVGFYTGSGKTVAFLAPLVQRLLSSLEQGSSKNVKTNRSRRLQVIIVAPGRELASQIVAVARDLLAGMTDKDDLTVMLAIGGTGFGRNLEQIRKRKPTILVGTPGRIAELVVGRPGDNHQKRGGRLKIGDLQTLVLDEFDALLEYKPHRDPTNAILECLKRRRGDELQSVLCSATASDMLGSPKLAAYLRDGYAVAMADEDDVLVTSSSPLSSDSGSNGTAGGQGQTAARVSRTVIHGVVHVPHRRYALETLRRILHTEPLPQQILVFVENSRKVDIIVDKLAGMGIVAAPLHGGRGSDKMDRAAVSKALREGYVGIVICTELAARGLDAPLLTHVINMDLPTDASHYAHRAGRCGRGGRPGVVINLTTSPPERHVPAKFANQLGVTMHAVEPRNGKLNIVEPSSQDID